VPRTNQFATEPFGAGCNDLGRVYGRFAELNNIDNMLSTKRCYALIA